MNKLTTYFAIAAALVAGCAGQNNECPSGTEALLVPNPIATERMCRRKDGQIHGPVVEIDKQGRESRIGQIVNGKKHGRWVSFSNSPIKTISEYRDGELERMEMFDRDGTSFLRSSWMGGLAHGSWRYSNGRARVERTFRDGQRSGSWRKFGSDGELVESRQYDDQGVLVTSNGQPVMPPRETIDVGDGLVLAFERCLLQRVGDQENRCLDLFEAVQRCDSPECESRALADYGKPATSIDPMRL